MPSQTRNNQSLIDHAPLNVLIVDDSAAIRKILQRVLDLNLGQVDEAGDGAEAVEILKNCTFGLILSEVNMPEMDGLELLAPHQKDGASEERSRRHDHH